MNIQSNFNNTLFNVALIYSLSEINKKIEQCGFNDYNDLCSAIRQLEIEISISKDRGENTKQKEELLKDYYNLKNAYLKAKEEDNKKKEQDKYAGIIICVVLTIIYAIIICAAVCT